MAKTEIILGEGGGGNVKYYTGTESMVANTDKVVNVPNCTKILSVWVHDVNYTAPIVTGIGMCMEDGTYNITNYNAQSYPTIPLKSVDAISATFRMNASATFEYEIMYV